VHIKQAKNIAWRIIEGNAYIVNTQASCLHSLDETGTAVWRGIAGRNIEFEKLLDKIHGEFEVDKETLRADLVEFVGELKDKGLVEVLDGK